MKSRYCFSVVFFILVLIYSNPTAQQPCTADFSVNDTSICLGESVVFTAGYSGADAYNWTFVNGTPNSASGVGPHTVQYNLPGSHDVELWVTCGNDRFNEKKEGYIDVDPCTCIASFGYEIVQECIPAVYRFYDTSTGATTRQWTFQGGTPSTANGAGPHDITYHLSGHYKVTLNIECAQTKEYDSHSTFIDPISCFDWGDAPDAYRTTSAADGARHKVNADVFLGDHIDVDPDGQPGTNADQDDLDSAPDDEDGVTFLSGLVPGHPCNVEVRASTQGWLQVWADLNINSTWSDAGEMVMNQVISGGLNNLSFNVPVDAVPGDTFLRFRFSLNGGLDFFGEAPDGEVEDYIAGIEEALPENDLGDAPASKNNFGASMTAYPPGGPLGVAARFPTVYNPTLNMYGPIHWWPHEIAWLGDGVTLENQADMGPDEDPENNIIPEEDRADLDGADDGVIFPLVFPVCDTTSFEFNVSCANAWPEPMYVNVWFDWNRNGTWNDEAECPDGTRLPDWAVQNQKIMLPTAGFYTFRTLSFAAKPFIDDDGNVLDIWMRITLSEQPWEFEFTHAGAGPGEGYKYGETEDYIFIPEIESEKLDFGDAPDGVTSPRYPTLETNGGASHKIRGPYFGLPPDADNDGRPSPDAQGDDRHQIDDEDGIYIPPMVIYRNIMVLVNVAPGGGYISGFIDFNRNDKWELTERVTPSGFFPAGPHSISVQVPADAVPGRTFARFRINSKHPDLPPDGPADDGEVEDYEVIIEKPIPDSKWVQLPDLTANGIDIKLDQMRHLADDFLCTENGLLTDIHFWGSWLDDKKGRIAGLTVTIYSDDPVGPGGSDPVNNFSMPDVRLWSKTFNHSDIVEHHVFTVEPPGEYWGDPSKNHWQPGGDSDVWRVDLQIDPDDAFLQTGTEDGPVIYWLALNAETEAGEFGWKTRQWPEHFMDDAVWDYGSELPRQWKELIYPKIHPYHDSEKRSIDLAFVLTFRPVEEEKLDWGDAPYDPEAGGYPTTSMAGGANHVIDGPWLGPDDDIPDADPDGQPEPSAVGDDTWDGNDDEDGVNIPVLTSGASTNVSVFVNGGGGVVQAWVDVNNDKIWQHPAEEIFTGFLPDGSHSVPVPIPAGLTFDRTFARFRISRKGGLLPKGNAPDGEVEDYMVRIRKKEDNPVKWSQPPLRNSASPEPDCYRGWDVTSVYSKQIIADDWICFDKRPVTDIHWWGSYAGWEEDAPPEHGPQKFHIGIWTDVPAGTDYEYSHPREMLWEYVVERSELEERYAGCDFYPEEMDKPDVCFRYDLILPEDHWFTQPGDTTVLWISIAAIYDMIPDENIWGWKTRRHYFMDDAIVIADPLTPSTGSVYISGGPVKHNWDMAFELTTNAPTKDLDFGDAPDPTYPTLSVSNGARHRIFPGFFLGATVDAEGEGRPSAGADLDDMNGQPDDEDGVIFNGNPSIGNTIPIHVRASQNGILNAWADWNHNGSWADPGEHIIPAKPLQQGDNPVNLAVPANALPGGTYMRFRFSRERALSYDGFASSGEVEDYHVFVSEYLPDPQHDLGDAPDHSNSHNITNFVAYPSGVVGRFPTVYWTGSPPHGPKHLHPREIACLGRSVSLENEADVGLDEDPDNNIDPPNNAADMDAKDDGIPAFPPLHHCIPTRLQYTVYVFSPLDTPMYANIWFDWNRDGDWDDTMECADTTNVYEWAVQNQIVDISTAGLINMTTPLFQPWHPEDMKEHPIWMRITLAEGPYDPVASTAGYGGAGPKSGYLYGETEDYYIEPGGPGEEYDFGDAPDPDYPTLHVSGGAYHILVDGIHLGNSVEPDTNGQPDPDALGDDLVDGTDDEDGVTFTSPIVIGGTANVTVNASINGRLNAWVDFTGDGDWTAADDHVFINTPLTAGDNHLSFSVPASAGNGITFARFRFNTDGDVSFTGMATDGEVEDYKIKIGRERPSLKWAQPPLFNSGSPFPDCFWGWDERSVHKAVIAADDWLCVNPQPVTAIEWWGSYAEWDTTAPPPVAPYKFHLGIWTDMPATEDRPWSHPLTLVWAGTVERERANERADRCDFYPEEMSAPDQAFRYVYEIPEEEWFFQEGDETIYWLSISAVYEDIPEEHVWGWKTRPHYFNDDAVVITDPVDPNIGDGFGDGHPISPDWDLAFVLHTHEVSLELDFGDAPDPDYSTRRLSNGAHHIINPDIRLGDAIDADPDGQATPDALGDDNDGTDDEDGINVPNTVEPGQTLLLKALPSVDGVLNIWIDLDQDGIWQSPEEHIVVNRPVAPNMPEMPWTVPDDTEPGDIYARVRFSTMDLDAPTGFARDGEVEDYHITVRKSETVETVHRMPKQFVLHQNHPNPFNPTTEIRYELPRQEHVKIEIYNLIGNRVRTLVNEPHPAGYFNRVWDARDDLGRVLPSGIYIYRIKAGPFVKARKLLLVK